MKPFQNMPSSSSWKSKSSAVFAFRSSDKLLGQIDDLVKLYHQRPDSQLEISYQIYRATSYWIRHIGDKEKVQGTARRQNAIAELNAFIAREFQRIFDVDSWDLDQVMTMTFGKPVHVAYEDSEVFNQARTVDYLFDEVRRREFKVVFRKGMACKRTETGLVLFDTTQMEGKDGVGEAIFVMDRFGNIFAGPYSRGEFHHSSFLAGGWSMAAGVIGVDQGQVVSVCPDSGHYQPGKQQMLNVVERLKTYGVNLRKLSVNLFQYETEGQFKGQPKQKGGKYQWDSSRGDEFLARR